MRIAVVDGQGGGIGRAIVEKLRGEFGNDVEIIALGTNALATSLMLRSGSDEGASGENAIVFNSGKVDVIMGAVAIIAANSMLGELTPMMAKAIAESPARKLLIPINRCSINIAGVKDQQLPYCIDDAIVMLKEFISAGSDCLPKKT